MAGEDVLTNAEIAAVAYKDAVDAAGRDIKGLFNQYFGNIPEFDINAIFSKATGEVDQNALKQLTSNLVAGGKGVFADISRAGATAEADVLAGDRARGFGGDIKSGLTAQRRGLAEAITGERTTGAKEQFLGGIGTSIGGLGESWRNLQTGMAEDAMSTAETTGTSYANESVVPPTTTPSATPSYTPGQQINAGAEVSAFTRKQDPRGNKPTNPKPREVFRGTGGVMFIYRPSGPNGPGWYRKP